MKMRDIGKQRNKDGGSCNYIQWVVRQKEDGRDLVCQDAPSMVSRPLGPFIIAWICAKLLASLSEGHQPCLLNSEKFACKIVMVSHSV